jgi:hypothetical protein
MKLTGEIVGLKFLAILKLHELLKAKSHYRPGQPQRVPGS